MRATGDAKRDASLIVWAIAEGRKAAREADEYLMGESLLLADWRRAPGPA